MSINQILNQAISLKTILIIGVFCLIVGIFMLYYLFGGIKEGFKAGLVGLGTALDYKMGDGVKRSWENPGMVTNIAPPHDTNDINDINDNKINDNENIFSELEKNEGGPIPLPEGELLIFESNKFSPECCPSTYSTGEGCLCAAPEQMKYLSERGGNRTLYDQY
jgi:hypothetical protein